MNKAKRIKTLEGYTKSLEERIEWLESWNMLAPVEQGELRKHQRATERGVKLGIRDPNEASENQFLNDPDPKTARFFARFLKHAADGIDCHDEERCSDCKTLHNLIRRWYKSA